MHRMNPMEFTAHQGVKWLGVGREGRQTEFSSRCTESGEGFIDWQTEGGDGETQGIDNKSVLCLCAFIRRCVPVL